MLLKLAPCRIIKSEKTKLIHIINISFAWGIRVLSASFSSSASSFSFVNKSVGIRVKFQLEIDSIRE